MLHDIILVSIPTRLFLHDDVHEGLSDVRRKAVEDMKKLREKSGTLKGLVRLLDLLLLTQTQSILFKSRFVFHKPDINLQVPWRGSESFNKFPEISQSHRVILISAILLEGSFFFLTWKKNTRILYCSHATAPKSTCIL